MGLFRRCFQAIGALRGRKVAAGDSQSAFPYGVVDFQKWVHVTHFLLVKIVGRKIVSEVKAVTRVN